MTVTVRPSAVGRRPTRWHTSALRIVETVVEPFESRPVEYLDRIFKGDFVIPKIPLGLVDVPSVSHRAYLHNVRTPPLAHPRPCVSLKDVDEDPKRDPPSRIVLAFGIVSDDFALTDETRTSLHRWLRTWNTPDLAARNLHGPRIRLRQSSGGLPRPRY